MEQEEEGRQLVERYLFSYPRYRQKLTHLRADIIYSGMAQCFDGQNTDVLTSPEWSEPTAMKALRLCTDEKINDLAEIITAIEETLRQVPTNIQYFIRLRCWEKPFVPLPRVCEEAGLTEDAARYWFDEVVRRIGRKLDLF